MKDLIQTLVGMGRAPRFHGNGFVQLYLSENQRLHVWAPSMPRIPNHNAAVHDHVYDMRSRVLLGMLLQVTYELPSGPYRPQEHTVVDVYRLSPEARRDPRGAPGFEHINRGFLRQTGVLEIEEYRSYSQARDVLHDSEPGGQGLVATLFTREPRPDDERNARVVCPLGEQPMNAFAPEHQPSERAMWSAIGLAVQRMHPSMRNHLYEAVEKTNA